MTLLVWTCLGLWVFAAAQAEECPNLTPENLARLKQLVATGDVHQQMVGDFVESWGAKVIQDTDSLSCSRASRTKVDDTHLSQVFFIRSSWLEGTGERNYTALLEKLETGVYLVKLENGFPLGKYYVLYAKDHVIAYYLCLFNQASDAEKRKVLPWVSAVEVRKDLTKTSLDEETQKSVNEAVSKLQRDSQLLREIAPHTTYC